MTDNPFDKIPSVSTLEKRFKFIKTDAIRQNTAVCFQYIIFLGVVNETYQRDGPIRLSLYRDMIVHTESVIESCLHYAVSELIQNSKLAEGGLPQYWEFKESHQIHVLAEDEHIVVGRKTRKTKVLKPKAMSQEINVAAKAAGILDEELFLKAEAIRVARNNIHFAGVETQIPYPSKSTLDQMFADAREIIDKIEEKLTPEDI